MIVFYLIVGARWRNFWGGRGRMSERGNLVSEWGFSLREL
jgi:hypothetical protein